MSRQTQAADHIEKLVTPFRRRTSMPVDEALARFRSVEAEAVAAQAWLVDAMRDAGWSWTAIGGCLGVSKQAAHQRWSGTATRSAAVTPDPQQMTLGDAK